LLPRLVLAGRRLAPAIVVAIGLVVLASAVFVFIGSSGFGYDFAAYYAAAGRIASGDPLYLGGTVEAYREGRYEGLYLYPPTVAAAFLPFIVVGLDTATLAWLLLRVALLVLGCLVLPVSWRARFLVLGVAGLSFPVLFDLNLGNVSIVVFTLTALAWRWIDSPLAAVAHAALIAIRFPFGVFAVTWLIQRNWRAIGFTVMAGIALIVLSLPFVGLSTYFEFFAIIRTLPDISVGEHNLSFKSMALELGMHEPIVGLALAIGALFGLAAIGFAAQRRDPSTAFIVTALATLIVAPFIHPHYLVLLLLPAAYLADRGHWWGLALPLLGWLPAFFLPLAGPLAITLVLVVSGSKATPDASAEAAPAAAG
jgi:hypothetical protein